MAVKLTRAERKLRDDVDRRMGRLIENWGPTYYDRDGEEITFGTWAALASRGDGDYKRVAQDSVGDMWISTVWLGLDHNYGMSGPPIIFETMIFTEGESDTYPLMWRYATEAEALEGHARAVRHARLAGTADKYPGDAI